jgi:hypothetical protein
MDSTTNKSQTGKQTPHMHTASLDYDGNKGTLRGHIIMPYADVTMRTHSYEVDILIQFIRLDTVVHMAGVQRGMQAALQRRYLGQARKNRWRGRRPTIF